MNQDRQWTTDEVEEAFGQVLYALLNRISADASAIVREEMSVVVGDLRLRERVNATLEMTCPDDGAELALRDGSQARQCPICRGVWESAEDVLYDREHRQLARLALMEDPIMDDILSSVN